MAEFVQDPFWASWGTNLANTIRGSGKTALDNTMTAEQIWALREKRARETAQWEATQRAVAAYPSSVPEATVPPSYRDVTFQPVGPANPADVPAPGENRPLGDAFLPTITTGQEAFIDPKALDAARKRRQLAIAGGSAAIMKDPSQWAAQQGYGEVTSAGLPTDPRERTRIGVQLTGRLPTAEERSAPTVHSFAEYDANNQPTGRRVASADNRTEFGTGRQLVGGPNPVVPPGHTLQPAGPADTQQKMTPEAARERLAVFLRNSAGGATPTPAQQAQIGQLADIAYPVTREFEDIGSDQKGYRNVRKTPIPPAIVQLMQPATAAAPAVAGADPAAAAAAAPAAPFDPNAPQLAEQVPGSAIELRKEYHGQPDIKRYVNTAATWNATVQHAYAGNKAADLALVYGFIKMMDDLTGVREGETALVSKIGSWAEQANTWLGNAQGTGLDARTRVKIVETMQRTMEEVRAAAQAKERLFTDAAIASKLAPKAVLGDLMPMVEFDTKRALAVKNEVRGRSAAGSASDEEKARLRAKLRGGQ